MVIECWPGTDLVEIFVDQNDPLSRVADSKEFDDLCRWIENMVVSNPFPVEMTYGRGA